LTARIKRDPRHEDIIVVGNEPLSCRRFTHWSMGLLGFQSPEARRQFGLSGLPEARRADRQHRRRTDPVCLSPLLRRSTVPETSPV
jgi:hypothetical protein